jgi:hypothetical protein
MFNWRSMAAERDILWDILQDLGYIFTEHGRAMEITGGAAGCIDDAEDASDLLGSQPNYGSDFLGLEMVVPGIEAQIHGGVGEREIKLFLGLVQGIGVGGGRALLNLFRDAEVGGKLIYLGFVEVSDGFQVGRAVAILDEETLIKLEAVGSAGDGIVETVGVVILHHLASALFEIGRGDDAEIGIQSQSGFGALTKRRLNDDRENGIGAAVQLVWELDLALIGRGVLRNDSTDGGVAALVTTGGSENAGNVLDVRANAERLGKQMGKVKAVR